MSLTSENSRVQYAGNNSASQPYPVDFVFYEPADLKVVVTNSAGVDRILISGSEYAVNGAGNENGGNVVTAQAYDSTFKVTIYRQVDATQRTVYVENADFPAKSHERALDKLTMLVQQIGRRVRQSFRLRESDGDTPESAKIASSVFGIGADGLPVFRTASELASFLNLSQQYFDRPVKTFANAAERGSTAPDFTGQIASQRDNGSLWISTNTAVGAWSQYVLGTSSVLTSMLADGILANSSQGRSKMADGFLTADSSGRAKMGDAFVTLAKIGAGIFSADAAGREKFASGFVTDALLDANAVYNMLPSGSVVQTVYSENNGNSDINSSIPNDDTIPQIGEGFQIFSSSITLRRSSNRLRLRVGGFYGINAANPVVVALFLNGDPNAIAVSESSVVYSGGNSTLYLEHEFAPATSSALTLSVRVGSTSTFRLNGNYNSRLFGGIAKVTFVIEEIKA